jgi:hypothetical protein
MYHHLLPIALVFVANNSGLFAFEPHPDAVPSSNKPGEVDIPENVKFIVADPKKLKGIVLDETDAQRKVAILDAHASLRWHWLPA